MAGLEARERVDSEEWTHRAVGFRPRREVATQRPAAGQYLQFGPSLPSHFPSRPGSLPVRDPNLNPTLTLTPALVPYLSQHLTARQEEQAAVTVFGTIDYSAPEVIQGMPHSPAADWWGFGVLLYELLFGKQPFASWSQDRTIYNITIGTLQLPVDPTVSDAARSIITELFRKAGARSTAIHRERESGSCYTPSGAIPSCVPTPAPTPAASATHWHSQSQLGVGRTRVSGRSIVFLIGLATLTVLQGAAYKAL